MALDLPHDQEEKEFMEKTLEALRNSSALISNIKKLQMVKRHELKYGPVDACQLFQRGITKVSGKGLGLYLTKSLVEAFGGRIWVEDRILGDHTKGSRFVIVLSTIENTGKK
jgi:hypothetical protein